MRNGPKGDRREHGASVYQCTRCGNYGCMKGMMMGYFGPYSGCWTKKPCPSCQKTGTKRHVGTVCS